MLDRVSDYLMAAPLPDNSWIIVRVPVSDTTFHIARVWLAETGETVELNLACSSTILQAYVSQEKIYAQEMERCRAEGWYVINVG